MLKWTLCTLICCQIAHSNMKTSQVNTSTTVQFTNPIIIGHRGASGYRPEHTLESYKLAIKMGADYIEPDLVITKDKVLIARHENEISGTTDVAIKFPDRKTTKTIDGQKITGWFTEDFTIKEIKTLRAYERLPFRSQKYNGKFEIPTFEEILQLAEKESKKYKRTIGVYPETKHPTYFQSIKLPLEEPLVELLKKFKPAVYIQSFELTNLKKIKSMIEAPLIYLIDSPELIPYDFVAAKDKRTYLDMLTKPENLKEIASVVYGIGPAKRYIIPTDVNGNELPATALIQTVHSLGLKIHPYTFRNESQYLLKEYKNSPEAEYIQFFELGVDGVFTDFPDTAIRARKKYLKDKTATEKRIEKAKRLQEKSGKIPTTNEGP